jgi:16S rRNA (cytidine1402-2'-O)-methyltransferase
MNSNADKSKGTLFLVSTPIGNLEDITIRAIRTLKEVNLICAEDTRTIGKLLSQYEIKNRVISYYSYNERKRIPQIINKLMNGESIALVSEAGTPSISDPGQRLVAECVNHDINLVPIPGPSSVIASLVVSGLPTDRFLFQGFLPRKKGRNKVLQSLSSETGTIVLFESAVRVQKTIEDVVKNMGNRYIVISRELTKKFEEHVRGFAKDILSILHSKKLKGEIVLLIAGKKYKKFEKDSRVNI